MDLNHLSDRQLSRRQLLRIAGLSGLAVATTRIVNPESLAASTSNPQAGLDGSLLGSAYGQSKDTDDSSYEVLFSIPIGPDSIQYSEKHSEQQQWGPKALAVAPDGSFVIANPVSRNLLHFSSTGTLLNTIDYSGLAQGVFDVKVTNAGIFALDGAAYVPAVLHLTHRGELVAKHEIPTELQTRLTGIALGELGNLLLEVETKVTHQLLDVNGNRANVAIPGLTVAGQVITIQSPDWQNGNLSQGSITAGITKIDVSVPNVLASPRILQGSTRNTFYAIVDELMHDETGALRIDEVVRQYSVDGRLLGMARFPLMQQAVPVDHPFAVGSDGAVYALLTRSDSVVVARLNFVTALASILPVQQVTAQPSAPKQSGDFRTMACISRNTIANNASGYLGNSKVLTNANVNGACTGRGIPQGLVVGNNPSVAYDWGGWDTVAGYNTQMDQGKQAGDIAIPGEEACSRGVDCSGLVTRCWGRTDIKYSTCTLANISNALGGAWLTKKGDLMTKCDDHCRLIEWQNSTGAQAWESTVDGDFDRVIYRFLNWSRYTNYTPRAYNNLCDP